MNRILLVLMCLFVACSQPSGAPTPSPVPSVSPPAVAATTAAVTDEGAEHPARAAAKPFVPKVDLRTPEQVAMAACVRSDGSWACPAIKRPLMASGGNGTAGNCGPACTVPAWFLDFANSSGCASDANSGTSATCTGAGIGPLLHMSQLYSRWGSRSPLLASSTGVTTIHVMSSQPIGSATADPWGTFAPDAPDGMIAVIGTLAPVGSTFLDGAVTQTVRTAGGHDFEVAGMPAGAAVGQILVNQSVAGGSACWVDTLGGGTATCTAPQNFTTLTTPTNDLGINSTNGSSWTGGGGDTCQLYTVPTIYCDSYEPKVGSLNAFGAADTAGCAWLSQINFGDASGGVGVSVVSYKPVGIHDMTLVRSDATFVLEGASAGGAGYVDGEAANCWFQGSGEFSGNVVLYACSVGAGCAVVPVFRDRLNIKVDTILYNGPAVYSSTVQFYGVHLHGGTLLVEPGAFVVLRAGLSAGVLWGAATVRVGEAAAIVNRTGSTYALQLLVTTLQVNFGTPIGTASTYAGSGVATDNVAITSANIDSGGAYGPGMFDPVTGARYVN